AEPRPAQSGAPLGRGPRLPDRRERVRAPPDLGEHARQEARALERLLEQRARALAALFFEEPVALLPALVARDERRIVRRAQVIAREVEVLVVVDGPLDPDRGLHATPNVRSRASLGICVEPV